MKLNFFTSILAVIAVMFLAGCDSMPKIPDAPQTVFKAVPRTLTVRCAVTPPPTQQVYLAGTPEQREKMMSDVYIAQTGNVATCNKRLAGVEEWSDEQVKVYSAPPVKP